ncbi:unnamed protein product [Clonostachys rosea f. rosea IK726]|uniref:Uncharacterized protein n=1 Tax=Clonostachys rosea f. rosea IK726 TaxID=1349383 RepID=A0ACA9U0I9_BIOOC|nr:unnamed protein product [Clonostachys rosea f. rosea IK726]
MEPQTQSQEDQIKAGLQTLRDGITQLLERKSRRDVLQEKRQEMLDDLKKEIAEIKGSADVNEADRAAYLMERFEQWTGTIPEEYYDETQLETQAETSTEARPQERAEGNDLSVQNARARSSKTRLANSQDGERSAKRPRRSRRQPASRKRTPTVPVVRAKKQAVADPLVGELYLVFWPGAKWYAGLVLPFENLSRFGLHVDFEMAGLLETRPACFRYDGENKKFLGWAEGYEDGGPMVSQRMYPVFYFDDEDDINACTYGWVSATDLKPFDLKLVASRYHEMIQRFIEAQLQDVEKSPIIFQTPSLSDPVPQHNAGPVDLGAHRTRQLGARPELPE